MTQVMAFLTSNWFRSVCCCYEWYVTNLLILMTFYRFTNALAKYVYMTYTRKPNFSSCMQLCLFRSPAYDRTGWVQPVTPTVVSVYCLASDKWRERKPSSERVTRDLTKNSSLPYYPRTCIIRRFRYKNSTLRRYRVYFAPRIRTFVPGLFRPECKNERYQ